MQSQTTKKIVPTAAAPGRQLHCTAAHDKSVLNPTGGACCRTLPVVTNGRMDAAADVNAKHRVATPPQLITNGCLEVAVVPAPAP
jgi:hypothetical protein